MRKRQYISILILFLCLTGCNKNTGEVKLAVHNTELFFVESAGGQNRYKDDAERKRAHNVITYSLTNTTDKKQLFFFDQHYLQPLYTTDIKYSGGMNFYLEDKEGKIIKHRLAIIDWAESDTTLSCYAQRLEEKKNLYAGLGITKNIDLVDNFITHSIIINPGETRTFKAIVSLPIIWESNSETHSQPLSYFTPDETDSFRLFYHCNAAEVNNAIPQYLKNELKNNGVEVFSGRLASNAVKLKKR